MGRLTYFVGDAAPSTQALPRVLTGEKLVALTRLPDGSMMAEVKIGDETENGFTWTPQMAEGLPIFLARFRSDGRVLDTMARYTCKRHLVLVDAKDVSVHFAHPLSDCPRAPVDPRGTGFYWIDSLGARDDRPTYFTISRRSLDGKVQWRRRVAYTPVPVPEAVFDSISESAARNRQGDADEMVWQAKWRRVLATTKHKPTVSAAVAGMDGTLFLAREDFDPVRRWEIWDSTGTKLGSFTLPNPSRILAASKSRIWVVEADKNEEIHVVRYRLGPRVADSNGR
jgi:hypothetical protein